MIGTFHEHRIWDIVLSKKCYILAGPNGAGKTTFANEFLPIEAGCLNFINADLIAQGLSPFQPSKLAIEAGRLMIQQINNCVTNKESFAIETTFSGKGYYRKIIHWKNQGYEIIIFFLKLPSVEIAIERVKLRVAKGGHNIPEEVIHRRYYSGLRNLFEIYIPICDYWMLFNNSVSPSEIIAEGYKDKEYDINNFSSFTTIKKLAGYDKK